MNSKRIDKAIEIINYAIQNQITVTEASVKCGFAYTYVKNVKALVYENYENGTLEDELFNRFVEAYEKYQKEDLEWKKMPRKKQEGNGVTFITGVCGTQVTNVKPADLPPTTNGESLTFSEDDGGEEATIEWKSGSQYPNDHIKTLNELLNACEVDLSKWGVRNYVVNKWDVTAVIDKVPRTMQNFQVKAWLEKNKIEIEQKSVGEMFQEMIRTYQPPVLHVLPKMTTGNKEKNLLEVSIFDLHMGKLAWGGETFENYDTKIARERFLSSIEKLLHRASGFQYDRILFPVGNDFFNSDTIYNTTTKGTPQDEDLRWQKTFKVGTRLLIDAINLLKQTGVYVDVVVIPGNHDFERSYYMGSVLEAWFNNDSMVGINNGASPRKYYRYGKVLLGLTHGSEEKESSLPLLMATDIESKPFWSDTLYHEWHVGHIHRKRNVTYSIINTKERTLSEDLGVTIRYLSSLTGTEEWHHKKGFVGQIKAADAFIWNDELGLVAHLNSNLVV